MNQKPALCCPTPAVKNGLHPHPIPESNKVPTTPGYACENPLFVQVCDDTTPPAPISLDGEDCDGNGVTATGNPGEITHVVQAPGTVFTVKMCPTDDSDFELSCGIDPATEHQIQTAYKIVAGEFVLIKRWDTVTGTEWTGDPATLEGCGGKPLEAEQELMCDNGVEFLRWYTIKDGIPTGMFVDTDFTGATYTVADETLVKRGSCVPVCADIVIRDCSGAALGYGYSPTLAPLVGATVEMTDCTGGVVYAFIMAAADANHTVPVTLGCGVGASVCGFAAATGCEKPGLDVETQVMCDNGVEFMRSFTFEDGAFVGKRDHKPDGTNYTVTDETTVVFGKCEAVPAICEPTISSAPADTLAGLLPGHSISVQKSNCCSIKVKTSAGDFIVGKDATGYSTGDFNCPVTVTAVEVLSGTCTLADIIITTQFAG